VRKPSGTSDGGGVIVCVSVGDGTCAICSISRGVSVGVGDGVKVSLGVPVSVSVEVGVSDGVRVAVGDGVADGVKVSLASRWVSLRASACQLMWAYRKA